MAHVGTSEDIWRRRTPTLVVGACALGVTLLSLVGDGVPGVHLGGALGAWMAIAQGGLVALAYVLAAWGLGSIGSGLLRGFGERGALQLAFGVAFMLTLSHGLGVLGALNANTAIGVVGVGLVLGVAQIARQGRAIEAAMSPWALCWTPGIVVLLVASANPAGWLWDSEFGGFDAMSYHLQLPREWLAGGRIWPVEHNVYSYLPSYVESAFAHLWHLTLAPGGDVLAGDAWRVGAAQFLHAWLAIGGAWMVRRLVVTAFERADGLAGDGRTIDAIGWLAGGLVLCTPWTVVTGSLAYNEMAVVLLGAGALLAVVERGGGLIARGLLIGWLVGVACGAKPTAIFLVGVPIGVILVYGGACGMGAGAGDRAERADRGRRWVAIVLAVASAAGLVALAPWLIRNWIASGNPVFPHLVDVFGTGVFGSGHWSAEQVERFAGAHRFEGSIVERLRAIVLPIAGSWRGLSHPQWGVFWAIVGLGGFRAVARRDTRALGLLLALGSGLGAWWMLTHVQSRFLLPMAPLGVLLAVTGMVRPSADGAGRAARRAMGVLALGGGVQSVFLFAVFLQQKGGVPNALLGVGAGWLSGSAFAGELALLDAQARSDRLRALDAQGQVTPEAWINLSVDPARTIYLLGDSTPMYLRSPLVYHTTWDASPLGEAMSASDDPRVWVEALRGRGIGLVLVNFAELGRLRRDGWYDPRVTEEGVQRFVRVLGEPVKEWARVGRAVYALPGEGAR